MQKIYIFWLRQLKKYFRSKSRIIGSLGQPILFLLAFGYGFGSVFQQAGQGNYLNFLAPGIISMSIIFTAIFSGIEIIWDRQFGFLKETLVAPVSRLNIMIGKTLGGATVATIQGVLVLFISLLFGLELSNWQLIIPIILLMFLIALLFTSLGILIASFLEDMQGFQLIMNFLIMPLFFLSGALFPLNDLPSFLQFITKINPLTYGVDALRFLMIDNSYFLLSLVILVLSVSTIILLFLGSFFFRRIQI